MKTSKVWRPAVFCSLGLLAFSMCAAQAPPRYKVLRSIPIGGLNSWDYLTIDSDARLAYVGHGTSLTVVNVETGKVEGEIRGMTHVHGSALVGDMGYVSDGGGNRVVVFDRKSFTTVGQIEVGNYPDALVYEPTTKHLFVFNGRGNSAQILDLETRKVIDTIPVPPKPEFAVQHDGMVYANTENTSKMIAIDAKRGKVVKILSLEGCEGPTGLAIDESTGLLYSGCGGNMKLAVVDSKTMKQVALVPIGDDCDGVAVDQARHLAFAANGGDGTLTVLGGSGDKVVGLQSLKTKFGGRTIVLDEKTHHLLIPAIERDNSIKQKGKEIPAIEGSFQLLIVGE